MNYKGDYIDGNWRPVTEADGELVRENPCRTGEEVFRAPWSTAAVDEAVSAARAALPAWDRLGVEGRREHLGRVQAVFAERTAELARAIAEEVGKPLWESTGEAGALTAKIEIMAGEGLALTREHWPEGLGGGSYRYRPLGVLSVLGPFNFPLHLPNGHIVPALLNGNCVVVKPSEIAGGAMQLYFECLAEAGLPDGVVNLVQGPGPVGARLAGHRGVNGVLFTGSWQTGLRIKEATLDHYWKLLALEMGGKNTSIVCEDADLDQAVYEIAQAAYLTTGQRCSATSRVVVAEAIADDFIDAFTAVSRRVTTGDALNEDCFMGPLVTEAAMEGFLAAQADDEGGKLTPLIRGGRTRTDLDGYFVSPGVWLADELDPTGTHQGAEIFGPDVVIYRAGSDAEAVDIANATEYGLAVSVFTADRERYDRMGYDVQAGVYNHNRSTCGASSRLPFGGVKKSGNHRPSALTAGLYCTYPQAQLRVQPGFDADSLDAKPLSLLKGE